VTNAPVRAAPVRAAPARGEMFRMLVFLVAAPKIWLTFQLSLVYMSSGHVEQGLPFAAITLMAVSYFLKGAVEAAEYVRSKIK
jgi:hypothetical protein